MSVRTLVKSIQDIMRQDSGVDGDAQRVSQLCWMFFLKIIDDQDQELEITRDGDRSPAPARRPCRCVGADARRGAPLGGMFFLKIIDDQDQELEITRDGYRSPVPARFRW